MLKHYMPAEFIDSSDKHILLIGVGGTGSQILTDLARMNQTLIMLGHKGFDVDVVDHDVVSTTNVGRQLYSMADVGNYKSVVLTTRLNMYFGTAWAAHTFIIQKATVIPKYEYLLVITAVDNVKTRFLVEKIVKAAKIPYWLDTGNMAKTGNVILGNADSTYIKQPYRKGCIDRLPNVVDLFGDVLKSAANEEVQPPSCSVETSLTKQDLFINKAVATFAMQILWNCFHRGYIEHHGAFINLDSMTVRPLDIDTEKWKNMGWKQKKQKRKYFKLRG